MVLGASFLAAVGIDEPLLEQRLEGRHLEVDEPHDPTGVLVALDPQQRPATLVVLVERKAHPEHVRLQALAGGFDHGCADPLQPRERDAPRGIMRRVVEQSQQHLGRALGRTRHEHVGEVAQRPSGFGAGFGRQIAGLRRGRHRLLPPRRDRELDALGHEHHRTGTRMTLWGVDRRRRHEHLDRGGCPRECQGSSRRGPHVVRAILEQRRRHPLDVRALDPGDQHDRGDSNLGVAPRPS